MALNPHQKNKVDINSLSEEEQKLFRLYGKLPNKKDLFQKKLSERRYFDSGDYALSKAGKSDAGVLGGGLGREHPSPESIPHLSQNQSSNNSGGGGGANGEQRNSISGPSGGSPSLQPTLSGGSSGSPVKESMLQRGMSVDDQDSEEIAQTVEKAVAANNSEKMDGEKKVMPIRQN